VIPKLQLRGEQEPRFAQRSGALRVAALSTLFGLLACGARTGIDGNGFWDGASSTAQGGGLTSGVTARLFSTSRTGHPIH
jgi:hypothetical protein